MAVRCRDRSYLVISKAIDYFDLARSRGGGSLARAFRDVRASFLVMSFSSDWLYPPHQSREIVEALQANGVEVHYRNLRSNYGHDAFLLEEPRQTALIRPFLRRLRERTRTGRVFAAAAAGPGLGEPAGLDGAASRDGS